MKSLTVNARTWLAIRFAALPLVTIAPFFFVKDIGATCRNFLAPEYSITTHRPTGHLVQTGVLHIIGPPAFFGALFLLSILTFLAVSLVQMGPKRYHLRRQFLNQQAGVSIVSALATIPLYIVMYQNSQWKHVPNWSCGSDGILRGTVPAGAHFGFGMAPIVFAIFAMVYILTALAPYTLLQNNKKRVGGQKTGELFQ